MCVGVYGVAYRPGYLISSHLYTGFLIDGETAYFKINGILVPATEHGYFVAK
jgi:hypothetical protein